MGQMPVVMNYERHAMKDLPHEIKNVPFIAVVYASAAIPNGQPPDCKVVPFMKKTISDCLGVLSQHQCPMPLQVLIVSGSSRIRDDDVWFSKLKQDHPRLKIDSPLTVEIDTESISWSVFIQEYQYSMTSAVLKTLNNRLLNPVKDPQSANNSNSAPTPQGPSKMEI